MDKLPAAGFGQRVKEIRKVLELSQKDFAGTLEISGTFLSEIENGKYKPGYEFFYNILTKFNVNLHFLLAGTGEMFNPVIKPAEPKIKRPSGPITNGEDLIWYIERSPMFMYLVLGYAGKVLYENKPHIDTEIETYEAKMIGKDRI
ncbi:MAG TPA: helix-turn-helix transcriptional regulator [Candidatus Deferrimicrobium sp.]|nr:helix-turn-helix transcriptional regulator [Candidatus Deferrimicrobium sp.]